MTEPRAARGAEEGVLLDIGDDAGALVLVTDVGLDGAELEVGRDGGPRTHSQVHPRRAGGRVHHAAVFPVLVPGTYALWGPDGSFWRRFEVDASRVTELDVRGAGAPAAAPPARRPRPDQVARRRA